MHTEVAERATQIKNEIGEIDHITQGLVPDELRYWHEFAQKRADLVAELTAIGYSL